MSSASSSSSSSSSSASMERQTPTTANNKKKVSSSLSTSLPIIVEPKSMDHHSHNQSLIMNNYHNPPNNDYNRSSSSLKLGEEIKNNLNNKKIIVIKFTPMAVKPTYEQIFDCIIKENIIQLKKFTLDGFGDQIYSWKNSKLFQKQDRNNLSISLSSSSSTGSSSVLNFIETIPLIQKKINLINNSIIVGESWNYFRQTFGFDDDKQNLELLLCRDQSGGCTLHLAVLYQRNDLIKAIVKSLPITLEACDNQGRTPLHLAALLPDSGLIYRNLVDLGAKTSITDMYLRRPEDYLLEDNSNYRQQSQRQPRPLSSNNKQNSDESGDSGFTTKSDGSNELISNNNNNNNYNHHSNLDKTSIQRPRSPLSSSKSQNHQHHHHHHHHHHHNNSLSPSSSIRYDENDEINFISNYYYYYYRNNNNQSWPSLSNNIDNKESFAINNNSEIYYNNKIVKSLPTTTVTRTRTRTKKKTNHQLNSSSLDNQQQQAKKIRIGRSTETGSNNYINNNLEEKEEKIATKKRTKNSNNNNKKNISNFAEEQDSSIINNNGKQYDPTLTTTTTELFIGRDDDEEKLINHSLPPTPTPLKSNHQDLVSVPFLGEKNSLLLTKFFQKFLHSSMNRIINVKEVIRQGNLNDLEEIVLQGYGDRLLGSTSSSAPLVQEFLDNLPNYLDQIDELHKASCHGNIREFQLLLDRYPLIVSRDSLGATPLHKAVLYGHYDLAEFIAHNFGPSVIYLSDHEKRTPLHYAAGLDDRSIYQMLLKYGPKSSQIPDQKNRTADFYLRYPEELNLSNILKRSQRLNANYTINLANRIKLLTNNNNNDNNNNNNNKTLPLKRKERSLSPNWNRNNNFLNGSGLYLTSTMADMNDIDDIATITTGSTTSTNDGAGAGIDGGVGGSDGSQTEKLEINSANLKRWIEENNIEMLEGVVLEGHGERLRQKASTILASSTGDNNNEDDQLAVKELFPRSKSYIEETVPLLMDRIKNIHTAVSMGDLTALQQTETANEIIPGVGPGNDNRRNNKDYYLLSKDHLGMTPLHKATIMGHVEMVQYILEKFPETVNARDREGRTALHYSTATTNRNGTKIYKILLKAGADNRVRDSLGKTPDYYRVHFLPIPHPTAPGSSSTSSTNVAGGATSTIKESAISEPSSTSTTSLNRPSGQKNFVVSGTATANRLTNNSFQTHQQQHPHRHHSKLHGDTTGGIGGVGKNISSRPRHIPASIRDRIQQALNSGNVQQLEELLLDGYGNELLGRVTFGDDARKFLKTLPNQMELIQQLHDSCINGQQEIMEKILQKHDNYVKSRDRNSFTPFHLAAINGHINIINHLAERFPVSIINLKDNLNRNALHLAAISGHTDIYRRLLELGFDPKIVDQKGKSPEHYLRSNPSINQSELMELLALGNTAALTNVTNARTLSKLSKTPVASTSNQPSTIDQNNNQNLITNSSNGVVSPSSKKLGAKPSRLPALPTKSPKSATPNSETRKQQEQQQEDEQPKSSVEQPETEQETIEKSEKKKIQVEVLQESESNSQRALSGKNQWQNIEDGFDGTGDDGSQIIQSTDNNDDINNENETKSPMMDKNESTIIEDDAQDDDQVDQEKLIGSESNNIDSNEISKSPEPVIIYSRTNNDALSDGDSLWNEIEEVQPQQNNEESEKVVNENPPADTEIPQKKETTEMVEPEKENVGADESVPSQTASDISKSDQKPEIENETDREKDNNGDGGGEVNDSKSDNNNNVDEQQMKLDANPSNDHDGTGIEQNEEEIPAKTINEVDPKGVINADDDQSEQWTDKNKNDDNTTDATKENRDEQSAPEAADESKEVEIEKEEKDIGKTKEKEEEIPPDQTNDIVEESSGDSEKKIPEPPSDSQNIIETGTEKGNNVDAIPQEENIEKKGEDQEDDRENLMESEDKQQQEQTSSEQPEQEQKSSEQQQEQQETSETDKKQEQDEDEDEKTIKNNINIIEESVDDETELNMAANNNGEDDQKEGENIDTSITTSTIDPNEEKLQKMIDNVSNRSSAVRSNVSNNLNNQDRLNELIKGWLEDGDLIRLEHVVIAGQGHRLLNIKSENKQVQDFLNLVPAYMAKIKRIHEIVIKGDLKDVQKTLTRKRFALCRDQYGSSPLHLAVLHGHVDILLYIITQFPETIDGPDNDGRTPFHYAAVLPDKHIYQILETAGASNNQKDRYGFTPVDYLTNGKLTIRDLLIKYTNYNNNNNNNNKDDSGSERKADLWERPPTSEIVSQLTPESSSAPSTANGEKNETMPSTTDLTSSGSKNNNENTRKPLDMQTESDSNANNTKKEVQLLQIEPREMYNDDDHHHNSNSNNNGVSGDGAGAGEAGDQAIINGNDDSAKTTQQQNEMKKPEDLNSTTVTSSTLVNENGNSINDDDGDDEDDDASAVGAGSHSVKEKKTLRRMETFDSTSANAKKLSSDTNSDKSPLDDKVFETLTHEFNLKLHNEKQRLRQSIDQQIENSDVIIKNGQNSSVIDSIQNAQQQLHQQQLSSLHHPRIANGLSAYGYDLTQIKDEHGRTVLHLAAAKDHKRSTFYKMLQQAKYLVPELDSKYRTIRDVAVLNGIKNNLQVIDQFVIDCFLNEDEEYLKLLLLEGYSTLLSVVDSEGNDIITLLKRNNITSMQTFIHEAAELQKNRDELHTFIRNGYLEGVVNLVENNPQLVIAKSNRGRCSLHLAVLFGNLDIIEQLIKVNHLVVDTPDNLGRTPLHYAMAMSKMEEIGRILIHSGADKAIRDVRMRTPSYYFVYKQDIRDIKREEQNLTI